MNSGYYRIENPSEWKTAGASDLVRLIPAPGAHALFLPKRTIETLCYAIASHEFIHLSGPTGGAKSSLVEALHAVPENFMRVCEALGIPPRPLDLHMVEMATYETPGEFYFRRALQSGTTYDEPSGLVCALRSACRAAEDRHPLIWLREMGRVHSATVQGGLLNLMMRPDIILPGGERIDASRIAWIADSNYQAESRSNHTLTRLDDALKRRFTVNLTLDYLPPDQETIVLGQLAEESGLCIDEPGLLERVVRLGHTIRQRKAEGALVSVTPPTIQGYLAFLKMNAILAHLGERQVVFATLLGNTTDDEFKEALCAFGEAFNVAGDDVRDMAAMADGLI